MGNTSTDKQCFRIEEAAQRMPEELLPQTKLRHSADFVPGPFFLAGRVRDCGLEFPFGLLLCGWSLEETHGRRIEQRVLPDLSLPCLRFRRTVVVSTLLLSSELWNDERLVTNVTHSPMIDRAHMKYDRFPSLRLAILCVQLATAAGHSTPAECTFLRKYEHARTLPGDD